MGDELSTYRCSMCSLNFPPSDEWQACASCGEPTDAMSHAQPNINQADAVSMRNHRHFQEYLKAQGRA